MNKTVRGEGLRMESLNERPAVKSTVMDHRRRSSSTGGVHVFPSRNAFIFSSCQARPRGEARLIIHARTSPLLNHTMTTRAGQQPPYAILCMCVWGGGFLKVVLLLLTACQGCNRLPPPTPTYTHADRHTMSHLHRPVLNMHHCYSTSNLDR